jgi:hypothetical protein
MHRSFSSERAAADVSLSKSVLSSDFYIFRPIYSHKGIAKLICKNRKISYTTARENILKKLKSVEPNLNLNRSENVKIGAQN